VFVVIGVALIALAPARKSFEKAAANAA